MGSYVSICGPIKSSLFVTWIIELEAMSRIYGGFRWWTIEIEGV